MATLSLNRAKKIGDKPLFEFQGQFVVMRHARNETSFRFTSAHKTQELATREAKRLVKINNGERFLVLQIVDSCDCSE